MIADQYYRSDGPNLSTFVNVPTRKMGVRLRNGLLVYVDILLINERNNRVQKAAEVETVIDDECVRRLIAASTIASSLEIYVLDGQGEKIRKILEDQHISHANIYEYYISPLGNLIAKPVSQAASSEQVR